MTMTIRKSLMLISFFLLIACTLRGQGTVSVAPLPASTAYHVRELPNGLFQVHGNHHNYSFNSQATLSSYLLSPQGIYLGISDSLQNTNTNDYWLWLPKADELANFQTLSSTSELLIQRFTPDSTFIYERTIAFPGADSILFGSLLELANGDLFCYGLVDTTAGIYAPELVATRIDASGTPLWIKKHPLIPNKDITAEIFLTEIKETTNGDIVLVMMADSVPVVMRMQQNGELLYSRVFSNLKVLANPAAAIADDGSMFITVDDANAGSLYLLALDPNLDVVWQKDLRNIFSAEPDVPGRYQLMVNNQGNCIFGGSMLEDGIDRTVFFAQFAKSNGALAWSSTYSGMSKEAVRFLHGMQSTSGDLYFCGSYDNQAIVVRLNASGQLFDGRLTGRVAIDLDNNCTADATEPPIGQWLVEAKGNTAIYHTHTDSQGRFAFDNVEAGQYVVKMSQQNYTWQTCPDSVVAVVNHDTVTVGIAVKTVFGCPVMSLDISTPFVRYCTENTWYVQWRNTGTDTAKNVRIEIELDPQLSFTQAGITPSAINGNQLTFNLPDVAPSGSSTTYIRANMDCATAIPGRAVCIAGHIYPDSLCVSTVGSWTGGMIEAKAKCENDTVRFELKNNGKNATGTLDFIIIEDIILLRNVPINLNPGQTQIIQEAAVAGGTLRLQGSQVPGHPTANMPSVAVEGCTNAANFSTGFLTALPNQTGNPFTDLFCDEIIASFDPNDKRGLPTGLGNQHIIEQNTPIDYIVRFQNTGTDTAFKVVVIDTLSSLLDFSTVRPGASSHPYVMSPSANNVLVFTFDPISLPDSTTNEPASHGFVQFRVNQKKDVPPGLAIYNTAHIYFDVNDPVVTQPTSHIIGNLGFTNSHTPVATQSILTISPNPANAYCIAQIAPEISLHQAELQLFDVLGRLVWSENCNQHQILIPRKNLPSGIYYLCLSLNGAPKSSTKLTLTD